MMAAQEHYDSLNDGNRRELLLKIGETATEAEILAQRDYLALGGWVKTRLKKYWRKHKNR